MKTTDDVCTRKCFQKTEEMDVIRKGRMWSQMGVSEFLVLGECFCKE